MCDRLGDLGDAMAAYAARFDAALLSADDDPFVPPDDARHPRHAHARPEAAA